MQLKTSTSNIQWHLIQFIHIPLFPCGSLQLSCRHAPQCDHWESRQWCLQGMEQCWMAMGGSSAAHSLEFTGLETEQTNKNKYTKGKDISDKSQVGLCAWLLWICTQCCKESKEDEEASLWSDEQYRGILCLIEEMAVHSLVKATASHIAKCSKKQHRFRKACCGVKNKEGNRKNKKKIAPYILRLAQENIKSRAATSYGSKHELNREILRQNTV